MSHRPIEQKKRNRVAKAFKRTPLTSYFDLWQWLIDRGHAKTRKEAKAVILASRVRSDSHVVGVSKQPKLTVDFKIEEENVAERYVPAALKANLMVIAGE